MMGIVLPETCLACNKICNKYHLLHLAYRLLYVPPGFTLKNYAWWLNCIYVFSVALRTNRLVIITEMKNVYCAVRTESLYNTDTFRPWRVKGSKIRALHSVTLYVQYIAVFLEQRASFYEWKQLWTDRSSRLEETAISSAARDPLAGWVLASSRSPPLTLKVA